MAQSFWNDRRDAKLKASWGIQSASQIADILGTTRNAVIGRIHRIRGTYQSKIDAELAAAREATERMKTKRDECHRIIIAAMLGKITAGYPRNRAVIEAREQGATLAIIGQAIGVSRERVRQIEEKTSAA